MSSETASIGAYRRLAVCLFLFAWEDLRKGGQWADDARAFLASEGAAVLADSLGLDRRGPGRLAALDVVPAIPEGCVTLDQAAGMLGVSRVTVDLYCSEGRLMLLRSYGRGNKLLLRGDVERVTVGRRAA